ncbi:diguanylate cyclase [Bordetella sp. FB-8]|uniref:GGDEF domain-containing protein n=1 Tax=Bordetella sp. FB-8 TaxID=1159870 RepID=UPI00037537C3|nr:GGDEF domain-containing protein [Bordetella sp. FB-8]
MQGSENTRHSRPSPRAQIGQRLHAGVAAACALFLALAVSLLWSQNGAYQDTRRAQSAFETLRSALVDMEKLSFERGPSNAAMGEEVPLSADVVSALRQARHNTDAAFTHLAKQLAGERCPRCAIDMAELDHARSDLARARANIDRIVQIPRSQRSARMLDDAINRMVAIVPQLIPIVNDSNLAVVKGDSNALDSLQMAFLAAMLREQAGLLGSRFTGALGTRRTLSDAEQFTIERSEGRIEQLYWLLQSYLTDHPEIAVNTFRRVQQQYFSQGLAYVADVRRRASIDGNDTPTTREFALKYVPMMHSIIEFRDAMLDSTADELHQRSADLRLRLLLTAIIGLASTGLLVLMLVLFRRYVIRPFNEATQAATAIAQGDLGGRVPKCRYPAEIRKFFEAIDILRESNRARVQLEREHQRLISELTTMAETDSLTGLLNRRAFESRVRTLNSTVPDPAPPSWVSMILFDIDYFKRINDTYGHDGGDLALIKFADLCRGAWQQTSAGVARLGGEEFAVLIETKDPAYAVDSATRFRKKLASTVMHAADGSAFSITASFGIAFMKRGHQPDLLAALMRRADALLYQAKAAGRDCIAVQSMGDEQPLAEILRD